MNGVLLDTSVFAMALTDDPRLTSPARERIDAADRVALSAISFYEIGQKVRLGKWPEMAPFASGLVNRAIEDGFHLLPLTADTTLQAALLDWTHRDPFDRLIAVTCLKEDLELLSPDAAFDSVGVPRIWD